jgi:hypothetical protein
MYKLVYKIVRTPPTSAEPANQAAWGIGRESRYTATLLGLGDWNAQNSVATRCYTLLHFATLFDLGRGLQDYQDSFRICVDNRDIVR